MTKTQSRRVQVQAGECTRSHRALVPVSVSVVVFGIAHDGETGRRQVSAYLMGSPRVQTRLEQDGLASSRDDGPFGGGRAWLAPTPAHPDHPSASSSPPDLGIDPSHIRWGAPDLAQVALLAIFAAERPAQARPDVGRSGGDQHATGGRIQTVGQAPFAGIPGGSRAAREAGHDAIGHRPALAGSQRMRRHAGGLIDRDQLVVLIEHHDLDRRIGGDGSARSRVGRDLDDRARAEASPLREQAAVDANHPALDEPPGDGDGHVQASCEAMVEADPDPDPDPVSVSVWLDDQSKRRSGTGARRLWHRGMLGGMRGSLLARPGRPSSSAGGVHFFLVEDLEVGPLLCEAEAV